MSTSWRTLSRDSEISKPTVLRRENNAVQQSQERELLENKDKYVCLYRVSTTGQGADGHGIHAQRDMCREFACGNVIMQEFVEVVSGRSKRRPILTAAIRACRRHRAKLLVSRFDRLSRSSNVMAEMAVQGVTLRIASHPDADETVLGFYAVIANSEARWISERTKAALKIRRARGALRSESNLNPNIRKYATLQAQAQRLRENRRFRNAAAQYYREGLTYKQIAEQIMDDDPGCKNINIKQVSAWLRQNQENRLPMIEQELENATSWPSST